jgi:hypothetical protein
MGDMVTMGGACPSCGHGFKPKIGKADTTTNQGGGVRENSAGTYIQGAGEANHINDVRNIVDKPERNEEKGAPNIKIAALTDTLKVISYSLVKHSQIQQLKKIKGSLPKKEKITDFPEEGGSAERENSAWFHRRFPDAPPPPSGALRSLSRKKAQIQQLKKIKGSLPKKHTDKDPEGTWQATPINDTLDQGEHTDLDGLFDDNKKYPKIGRSSNIDHDNSIVQGTGTTSDEGSQVGERMGLGRLGQVASRQGVLSRRNAEVLRSYTEKIKKINDDLGDARGCTEHKHQ